LAAIPKSVIQTAPGFITGIVALHLVEHHRAFQSRLVAKRHVGIFVRNSEEHFPNCASVSFWELGEFFEDLGCAHDGSLTGQAGLINLGELFEALALQAIVQLLYGRDTFRNGARVWRIRRAIATKNKLA
jgi:hypothetical protein